MGKVGQVHATGIDIPRERVRRCVNARVKNTALSAQHTKKQRESWREYANRRLCRKKAHTAGFHRMMSEVNELVN